MSMVIMLVLDSLLLLVSLSLSPSPSLNINSNLSPNSGGICMLFCLDEDIAMTGK